MNTENDTPEPTDAQLDAQLLSYDPVYDVPSSTRIVGNVNLPEPTLQSLPPEMRDPILAKLATVTPGNRELFEREFILEALEANSLKVRQMGQVGEGATEVQKADAEQANGMRLLTSEAATIKERLEERRMVLDPITNEMIPTEHLAVQGDARSGWESRLRDIGHELSLLQGREGDKRRAEALDKDKARIRSQRKQLAEGAEIERRAEHIATEQRINKQAEARARFKTSTLG